MNRGIEVLQTFALPLGYGTVLNFVYYDIIAENFRFVKGFCEIYRNYFAIIFKIPKKRAISGIQPPFSTFDNGQPFFFVNFRIPSIRIIATTVETSIPKWTRSIT